MERGRRVRPGMVAGRPLAEQRGMAEGRAHRPIKVKSNLEKSIHYIIVCFAPNIYLLFVQYFLFEVKSEKKSYSSIKRIVLTEMYRNLNTRQTFIINLVINFRSEKTEI